jgi:hypothetical protein
MNAFFLFKRSYFIIRRRVRLVMHRLAFTAFTPFLTLGRSPFNPLINHWEKNDLDG